jgi:hypothetical protein
MRRRKYREEGLLLLENHASCMGEDMSCSSGEKGEGATAIAVLSFTFFG